METLATLLFLRDIELYQNEKPYFMTEYEQLDLTDGDHTNLEFEKVSNIVVKDIRGCEEQFKCESHSFEFTRDDYQDQISSDPEPMQAYCKHMIQLTTGRFAADFAICYDFRTRLNRENLNYEKDSYSGRDVPAPPVPVAHIDHTKFGGFHRIRRHLTEEEAEKYLSTKYRARIINVWRPLRRKIEDSPMAFCDYRSLAETDLVAADRVSPEYVGEIYYVKHQPGLKWYWLSDQDPSEIAVFVTFDSMPSRNATPINFCAHAAFANPHAHSSAPARESVEVRVIIFNRIL